VGRSKLLDVFRPVETARSSFIRGERVDGKDAAVELRFVMVPGQVCYIEWPEGEPMVNIIAMMKQAERGAKGRYAVRFDPDDDDLLEVLVGGYRLHGMFVSDLLREE
jgi:hypothetical protein